uniref:Ribosomal protein S14 n=1 Tax=Ombrophytum subterraneum TaxID=50155 RepID=A0A8E7IV55_9MAGN|nr:ribosomal protein S14 [Ombrophytum subterraneum]
MLKKILSNKKKYKFKKYKFISTLLKNKLFNLFFLNDKFEIKIKLKYILKKNIYFDKFFLYNNNKNLNINYNFLSRQTFIKYFYKCLFSGMIISN